MVNGMDRGAEASWVPCQSLRRPSHRDGVNTPAQSTTPCRSSARSCRRSGSSCRCLSLLPLSGSPASAPRPRRIRELLQPSDPSRYSRAPRPQNFPPPTGYGTRPGGCPAPALRQGTPAVRGLAGAGGRGRRRTARPEAGALARTTGEDRPRWVSSFIYALLFGFLSWGTVWGGALEINGNNEANHKAISRGTSLGSWSLAA